jgi:hypothetical protein
MVQQHNDYSISRRLTSENQPCSTRHSRADVINSRQRSDMDSAHSLWLLLRTWSSPDIGTHFPGLSDFHGTPTSKSYKLSNSEFFSMSNPNIPWTSKHNSSPRLTPNYNTRTNHGPSNIQSTPRLTLLRHRLPRPNILEPKHDAYGWLRNTSSSRLLTQVLAITPWASTIILAHSTAPTQSRTSYIHNGSGRRARDHSYVSAN